MSLPESKYLLSPYITVYPPESQPHIYKVNNSLTGKTFELGEQALQVLRRFRSYTTFPAVLEESGLEEKDLEKLSDILIRNRFIISDSNSGDYAITLSKTQSPIFGVLNNYVVPPGGKTIDFIGVPFGRGNDIDYGTRTFPDLLRSKTSYFEFNPDGVRQISFSFLDSKTDFTALQRYFSEGAIRDSGNIFFNFNESTDYCYDKIEAIARASFSGTSIPVFIGGDHSITYPIVRAAADKYPSLRLLHFDAHLDTYYSKYDDIRHEKKISHNHSNFMRHCLELEHVKEVRQFGIRGISNRFTGFGPKQHVCWIDDVREIIKCPTAITPTPADAEDVDTAYYLTLDIDILDPSCAMGTGSPSVNGLQLQELIRLLQIVLPGKRIIGLDLVEVNPSLDKNDLTTQCAIYILLHILNLISL
jgi:agmatinase